MKSMSASAGRCVDHYHHISGNINARQTSMQLFGFPSPRIRHDFPTHLDQFTDNSKGILGPVSELINKHTLYAFHAPFLDENTSKKVTQAMRAGRFSAIRDNLGLAASRLGVTAPLKACRACIHEDVTNDKTSWWKLEQQWPTAHICRQHQEPLLIAKDQIHRRTFHDLILPTDLNALNTLAQITLNAHQIEQFNRIMEWTEALIGQHEFQFSQTLLRYTYLLQAKKLGYITMDGSLRLLSLRETFTHAHHGLENFPGLSFLGSVSCVNGGFLGLLLRQYHGVRHPMKHIFLMAFLFFDPEEFFDLYRRVDTTAKVEGTSQLPSLLTDTGSQLRDLVVNQTRTVNSAASELGIYTTQAVRYLIKENVPYQKRPRVLTSALEVQLKKMLQAGDEREEIATTLGIRKSFIKDYLASHPTMRSTWEQAHLEHKLQTYRNSLLTLLAQNPRAPIKRIRQTPGSGFQWLYRHDRSWLARKLPSIRRKE